MKTKKHLRKPLIIYVIMIVPVILMLLIFISCSAGKRASRTQTEIAAPPPPPPPPTLPQSVNENEEPFVVVEEMPMFPGGDSLLLQYIAKNTRYPDSAKINHIQGKVITRFCVTAKGGVGRVSILRGVSPDLDREAIRVISSLPAFFPGKQGGKAVPVWFMVPITFALGPKSPDTNAVPSPPPAKQPYSGE